MFGTAVIWVLIVMDRVVIPGLAAAFFFLTRWGKDNLVYVLVLPLALLVWRMYGRQRRLPKGVVGHPDTVLHRLHRNWRALDIFSIVFLMVFEAGVGVIAQEQSLSADTWTPFLVCVLGPYVVLALLADTCYLKAVFRFEYVKLVSVGPPDAENI